MRSAYGLAIATACGGCAQVFGLDETTGFTAATLDLQRISIGSTVKTSPQGLMAVPSFLDTTGTATPSVQVTAGHWMAASGTASAVVYTAPDLPVAYRHDLELTAADLRAGFVAFEHPAPTAAADATLMLTLTLPGVYTSGQVIEIDAIGAWMRHPLGAAELPAINASTIAAAIPYSSFTAMTASPRAQITTDDTVVVLRTEGSRLTGAFFAPAFNLGAGATMAIDGTMTLVSPVTPFSATIDPTAVIARYANLKPAGSAMPGFGWQLAAAPGYSVGVTNGIQLDAAAIAMTDTSFSAMYANPFAAKNWPAVLTYSSSTSRTFMVGGATVGLSASLSTMVDPASGLTLDLPAGLPTSVSLGGTALEMDGMTVAVDPAKATPIVITADRTTGAWYQVGLVEISVVGTTVKQTPLISIAGPTSTLSLPPMILQAGHTYVLVSSTLVGGYTAAATGDLRTFTLPATVGQATSAVFTVSP